MTRTKDIITDAKNAPVVTRIDPVPNTLGEPLLRAYFGTDLFIDFSPDSIRYRKPLTLEDLDNFKPVTLAELNSPKASFMELNNGKPFKAVDLKNLKHFTLPDQHNPTGFRCLVANQLLDDKAVWETALATWQAIQELSDEEYEKSQPFDEITEAQLQAVERHNEASLAHALILDGSVSTKEAERLNQKAFEALDVLYEMTWEERLRAAEPLARAIEKCLPQEYQDLPENPMDACYPKRYRETMECIAFERLEEQQLKDVPLSVAIENCIPPTHEEVLARMDADRAEMKARLDRGERVPRDWFDELRVEQKADHDKQLREAMKLTRALLNAGVDPEEVPDIVAGIHTDLDDDEIQNMRTEGLKYAKPPASPDREPWDPAKVRPFWETAFEGDTTDYVVDGVFKKGAINLIVADSGVGKTNLNVDIMFNLIRGRKWAGKETKPSRVWIMDKESAPSDIRNAIGLLGISSEKIDMFSQPFLWLTGQDALEPDDPDLIAQVEACEGDCIITFDSLLRYIDGDENDSKTIKAFWNKCKHLCDLGATVIVLHHENKAGSYRGSSDIKAGPSIMWQLASNNPKKLDEIAFKAIKFRGQGQEFKVKFDYKAKTFVPVVTNYVNTEQATRQAKLGDLLKSNGGVSQTQFERLAVDGQISTREQAREYVTRGLGLYVENRGSADRMKLWWKGPPGA